MNLLEIVQSMIRFYNDFNSEEKSDDKVDNNRVMIIAIIISIITIVMIMSVKTRLIKIKR